MTIGYNEAAKEVRRMLNGLKAVDTIANALDMVGSMEAAAQDAKTRLYATNKDIEKAKSELDSINVEIESAKAKAAKVKADAKAAADKLNAAADEKIRLAFAEAEAVLISAKNSVDAMEADKKAIHEQIKSASVELADIEGRVEKAKKFLAKLSASE